MQLIPSCSGTEALFGEALVFEQVGATDNFFVPDSDPCMAVRVSPEYARGAA